MRRWAKKVKISTAKLRQLKQEKNQKLEQEIVKLEKEVGKTDTNEKAHKDTCSLHWMIPPFSISLTHGGGSVDARGEKM